MPATTERRTAISLTPSSRPRLCLQPDRSARMLLDGGWWPRSADPAAELPGLILALDERHGPFNPITRIMVGMAGWDPSRPRRLQVGGPAGCRAVRIGWFATMPAGLLIATSARGQRTDLLTVPSDGSDQAARAAMDQAPGPATAVTLPPSWPPSPGRPGLPAPQPGRRLRAPGWAPGNGRAASCTTTRRRPPARGPRLRPGRHARSLPRPARDAHDQRRRHRPPHRQPSANRPGRRPHYRQATWRPGLRRRPALRERLTGMLHPGTQLLILAPVTRVVMRSGGASRARRRATPRQTAWHRGAPGRPQPAGLEATAAHRPGPQTHHLSRSRPRARLGTARARDPVAASPGRLEHSP